MDALSSTEGTRSPISTPGSIPPLTVIPGPYFPKAEAITTHTLTKEVPKRPTEVGPVFNPELSSQPIQAFSDRFYATFYGSNSANEGTAQTVLTPQRPTDFQDPYLFPSLTRDERLRLTMLWYYTHGLSDDSDLLVRLQDKLNITRELMGWEFAIMGILDNDVYTRVVTSGLPLAILPRRESTCSHTINQPSGSVFMLTDMDSDWRFKHSPHVEIGGLRSYAGTQLRCQTERGQTVALGSVCVASNTVQSPLSAEKQQTLVKFADMLTAEITTSCQLRRQRQRRLMADLISDVQEDVDPDHIEEQVLQIVRKVYPEASISVQETQNDLVILGDMAPIPFKAIHEGLWEDSRYIDAAIASMNQERLRADRTVRAVVFRCDSSPAARMLIVASSNVQQVFDDIDAWFVERCSLIIKGAFQERSIREAIEIKDRFFRGITHQLRTPIHGILGSCELLGEELTSPNPDTNRGFKNGPEKGVMTSTVSSYLATIRSSGEELMSTINNMLKLNRWSEIERSPPSQSQCTLEQLESDICAELVEVIPEAALSEVMVYFQNETHPEKNVVSVDMTLLKECLQSLLVNAIQATDKGSVIFKISTTADFTVLRFDVIDTGCGIKAADQQRIFRPYEKAHLKSRGAGLGLTLASKIAATMNGSVFLVSSEEGKGSHFRAEIYEPAFSCPSDSSGPPHAAMKSLPSSFQLISLGPEISPVAEQFARYLERVGLTECKSGKSLAVVGYVADSERFASLIDRVDPDQIAVCLLPVNPSKLRLQHETRQNILFFTGPFTTHVTEDALRQVQRLYGLRSAPTIPPTPAAIDLPLRQLHAPRDLVLKSVTKPSVSALLVDDNPINLRIMRMYCEKRHIPFTTAVDGDEAVEHFSRCGDDRYPSLILMDLQMPRLDGASATAEIRRLETQRSLAPTVIFIISGQDSPADKTRSFKAGANEYFVKPARLKALDSRIRHYFESFKGG